MNQQITLGQVNSDNIGSRTQSRAITCDSQGRCEKMQGKLQADVMNTGVTANAIRDIGESMIGVAASL